MPYGVQAENMIFPVVKSLDKSIDFSLNYIGGETSPMEGAGKGSQFNSMHGQGEVDEDLRQLCAMKQSPAKPWTTCWSDKKHSGPQLAGRGQKGGVGRGQNGRLRQVG